MNDEISTARVALKWGLITGLALIVYSTLLYSLDQMANRWLSLIVYGIIVAGLVLGMREYRARNGDYLGFGEGVGLGISAELRHNDTVNYKREPAIGHLVQTVKKRRVNN